MFSALGQISKHSVDLAELVVEAEIFPAVLACLRDPDEYVRKNVTTLMREITKHTPEVVYPPPPTHTHPQALSSVHNTVRRARRELERFPRALAQRRLDERQYCVTVIQTSACFVPVL